MLKKRISIILVVCMLALTIAGCGDKTTNDNEPAKGNGSVKDNESAKEKVLVWNNGPEPSTMDPGLNAGTDAAAPILHMYEGLLREIDNKMEPAMAESYDVSEDGLNYTFHLRDAKWSDGEPVTASNFEYAWTRALDPEVASPFSWIFEAGSIKSFKAIDDKTFEVNLISPAPYFLGLLAGSTFMPLREDKIDYLNGGWALDPSKVVTNGAYTMESYVSGDKIVLSKNPEYWQADKVNIDKIDILMIVDSVTALTAFESNEVDALLDVPPAEIPRLLSSDDNFKTFPANASYYLALNSKKKPFDDIRVRKALTLAIDRNAIVNDVTKGGEDPAHSLIPGVIYDPNGKRFNEVSGDYGIPMDLSKVEEAKQLLAEAGYPSGEGFPVVEYLYNTSDLHKTIAETLQQMWKTNLGIDINLVNMESAVFHQTRVAHDFDITRGGWGGDYNDPLTYLDMFLPGAMPNYSDWTNEEYANLIAEAKVLDGEPRYAKFYQAEKLLMESYNYIPVYYNVNKTMVNNDRVNNWEMTTTGIYNFVFADIVE